MNIHRLSDVEEVTLKIETQLDSLIEKVEGKDSWNARDVQLINLLSNAKKLMCISRSEAQFQQIIQNPVKRMGVLVDDVCETTPDQAHHRTSR